MVGQVPESGTLPGREQGGAWVRAPPFLSSLLPVPCQASPGVQPKLKQRAQEHVCIVSRS